MNTIRALTLNRVEQLDAAWWAKACGLTDKFARQYIEADELYFDATENLDANDSEHDDCYEYDEESDDESEYYGCNEYDDENNANDVDYTDDNNTDN